MLRPLSASNTTPNFKGFVYTSDDSNNFKNTKSITPDLKNGFYAGLIIGASLATTGTFMYKDYQVNRMLKDIAATKLYDEADSFTIRKITDENIPNFILIDKNGDETVYDMTSGKIYLNEDGELVERE